jgi:ribosomal-protein-alanine N-acetyltransferase
MGLFAFKNFPILKTERLLLREVSFEDTQVIFELRSSEEINKFVATKRVQNLEEVKSFITKCKTNFNKKSVIFWAIEYNNEVIGTIVFHKISLDNNYLEIGYKLKPSHQQKGLMSEVFSVILEFGFKKMNVKTFEAFTHKNNIPSIALLEKYRFVFQPKRRDEGFENNRIYKLMAGF